METVLNNNEQMILLLGWVMVVAGYLVENVMVRGVGWESVPLKVPVSRAGMIRRADDPEETRIQLASPRERCSLTKSFRFP